MDLENNELDLPRTFSDALRATYAHHPQVPPAIDTPVLSAARETFARRRRMKLIVRWGTGVAAGLAAAIVIVVNLPRTTPTTPSATLAARGDVNADGRVNMVDALALAKRVAARDTAQKRWDVNGDGQIDNQDVDAIAAASVNLKQPSQAKSSLPKLEHLGIKNVPVGSALADGTNFRPAPIALARPVTESPAARTEPRPPVVDPTEVRQ